ncbi:MAG: protein translocase subunit SecE [marine bacterium B5-7]|nr:MAG: protein translocase subunit SecE [marine bacterium B5-7]
MNTNVETTGGTLDTIKLGLALLIAIAALVGFYFFADQSLLYRVLGLLTAAGISVAIALQTEKGRHTWGYFQDAQIEVRKVVWPTRQETVQTTLIVIIMVILVAIILWLLDMFLGWSIGSLMGHGG